MLYLLGHSQNHLAVAGGCKRSALVAIRAVGFAPTRYREVVLTVPKYGVLMRNTRDV